MTIAKLRAARLLWARFSSSAGRRDQLGQRQHAVTSRPMMSKYDPWVNMLRTTVAAFAAAVGGADAVTVQPFDRPLGRPDAFGRRIARNQMALLTRRVPRRHRHRPGRRRLGGRTADSRPRRRRLGVPPGARGRGVPRRRPRRHRRRARPAGRHPPRPITGLTEFPNLAEALPERDGEPDDVRRYGAAFEALRDEPAATPVFLATMGSVAAHTARATFATNLFAAGGIDVATAGPTNDADGVLAAYAGQPVVCLAGPDAAYDGWGADAALPACARPGARCVILAGKPRDLEVDDSCAIGVDALAFLQRTQGGAGVSVPKSFADVPFESPGFDDRR